jgi:hypothetical protein
MSEMLHVMRKDALRLRWMLVLWLAVLAARVASMVSGWNPTDDLSRTELALLMSSRMMTFVELLLAALITTRLVHEEPLVGPTAFWLTRPYHRGSLLGAKLSFLLVVLVVLPLLADLATMASLGAGTRALVAEGPLRAIDYLGTVLPLMVIAAITPSLSAFVLTVVGIAGTGLSAAALASLARTLWPAEPGSYAPPGVPDATPGVVMLAMYLCTGLAVVAYQYHRRGRQGAALLAGAGLAATLVVPQIWPWSFARAEGYEPGTWAATAAAVHDPSWDIEGAVPPGRGASGRRLMARVTLSGAPPEITVASTGVRGTLRMPDGAVIESGHQSDHSWNVRFFPASTAPNRPSSLD